LRKGAIEYGYIVLHPKTDIGILVHGAVTRRLPVCRAQRDRLVAVFVLDSDPAVIVIVPDIAASEDDKARLDLLFVEDETHFYVSHCAETVQIGGVSA
jgi:hypothetical protein